MPTFQILCLANSYKYQGRCIAGLRKDGKGWIRPVSADFHGTLFPPIYQLPNQEEPQLFDILEIDFIQPLPQVHQPENWLIDTTPWRLVDRLETVSEVQKQKVREFITDIAMGKPYIFNDFEKKIKYDYLASHPVSSSLVVVKPEQVDFKISSDDDWKIKASFKIKNSHYCLSVTDPVFLDKMQHLPDGNYPALELKIPDFNPEQVFFTISLGEPYFEYCYKLVAAVISV